MLLGLPTNAYHEAVTPPELCSPDAPPLDPKTVQIFYDPKGFLRATVGDRTYLDVTIVRAFPLTPGDPYIGLLSGRLSEIGIIADPSQLDEESQHTIEKELERRYFTAQIRSINAISEEFGATYWDVETDRGQRFFVAKGVRDNVTYLGRSRILIHDVDGNRYEVADLTELDPASRSMILRVI